jgi:hypothetical protein
VKNNNCDGDKCVSATGETRRLPIGGDGAVIVCRACYENELRFRRQRIAEGVPFDLPNWDSLKVMHEAEVHQPYQPKTGAKCGCRRGVMRDNCPTCEGTGWVIDFARIRARHHN